MAQSRQRIQRLGATPLCRNEMNHRKLGGPCLNWPKQKIKNTCNTPRMAQNLDSKETNTHWVLKVDEFELFSQHQHEDHSAISVVMLNAFLDVRWHFWMFDVPLFWTPMQSVGSFVGDGMEPVEESGQVLSECDKRHVFFSHPLSTRHTRDTSGCMSLFSLVCLSRPMTQPKHVASSSIIVQQSKTQLSGNSPFRELDSPFRKFSLPIWPFEISFQILIHNSASTTGWSSTGFTTWIGLIIPTRVTWKLRHPH